MRRRTAKSLDQNGVGQLGTQADADVAHLTNHRGIGVFEEEFDPLFLAKTHFAKPVNGGVRTGQLLDSDKCPRPGLTQRANPQFRTVAIGTGRVAGVRHIRH